MEKKPIPEVGKTYKCFDDGKITRTRMYNVLVTRVVPIQDFSDSMRDLWDMAKEQRGYLFFDTDYIIESVSYEQDLPKICFFGRDREGYWFGLGECVNSDYGIYLSNTWCSGVLDVDGELYKRVLENEGGK